MNDLTAQILSLRAQGASYAEIFQQLIHSGVDQKELRQALELIAIDAFDLRTKPKKKNIVKPVAITMSLVFMLMISITIVTNFSVQTEPLARYEVSATANEQPMLVETNVEAQSSPPPVPAHQVASSSATVPASASATIDSDIRSKDTYTIAVFGDSMEDTMGEKLELLTSELKARYPDITFQLYNYGIGAENVSMGLARFDAEFTYKTRQYPPLAQLKPDILIVGSFAYNPFIPYDRNQHWLEYSQLIDRAVATKAQVYILAEIAPLQAGFGVGPNGVNWPTALANDHSAHIKEQLANVVGLAALKGVPLINAFAASELGAGWGNKVYVSTNDGIHPSEEGQKLTAKIIAQELKLN